jgi:hypothetical protein
VVEGEGERNVGVGGLGWDYGRLTVLEGLVDVAV